MRGTSKEVSNEAESQIQGREVPRSRKKNNRASGRRKMGRAEEKRSTGNAWEREHLSKRKGRKMFHFKEEKPSAGEGKGNLVLQAEESAVEGEGKKKRTAGKKPDIHKHGLKG